MPTLLDLIREDKELQEIPGKIKETAKEIGSGILKGAIDTLGMGGDIVNAGRRLTGAGELPIGSKKLRQETGIGEEDSPVESIASFFQPGVGGKAGAAMAGMIAPKIFSKAANFEKSTIRNLEGELIPLYHGGTALEEGMPSKGSGVLAEGLYLTGYPGRAEAYTKGPGKATYQVYANLQNPIDSDTFTTRFGRGLTTAKNAKIITETLKKEGYDGVVDKDKNGRVWEAVSFYPERDILSALSGVSNAQQVVAKDTLYKEALTDLMK